MIYISNYIFEEIPVNNMAIFNGFTQNSSLLNTTCRKVSEELV